MVTVIFPDRETEKRDDIEMEFGIPFPGRILPPEQWTRTALKKLPINPFDFLSLFGRVAPIVLDLGCGNGRFIISNALAHPDFDHVGIDILPVVIRYATRRANQRGIKNVRFAVRGALEFLKDLIVPHTIREIHIYHPQPYHDPHTAYKRLFTPEFVMLVHRSLECKGKLVVQTDNPSYWEYLSQIIPHFFVFEEQKCQWPDAPDGRTRREIIARRQGLMIFRGFGTSRTDLDSIQIEQLLQSLPLPNGFY